MVLTHLYKCRRFTKQSQVFPLKFLVGTKLQFRKAQITQKTRRKLYCDYLNNLNHQKLNEWLSLRSAQKSLVYFRTKKREFLNNALIVQTKSSHICGIRNTSFVHSFILSYQTHSSVVVLMTLLFLAPYYLRIIGCHFQK